MSMDVKRFRDLLAEHGAELARWPAAEQGEARELLSVSADAAELRRRAGLVERALSEPAAVSVESATRVLHRLDAVPLRRAERQTLSVLDWLGRPAAAAAVLVVLALVGVAAGAADLVPNSDVIGHFDLLGLVPNSDLASGFGM
ncbi:MAG TPA: hypothetical protein VGB82_02585 [Alphaproteobacteria bacterium]